MLLLWRVFYSRMLIQLHNTGKRFNRDWIFRNVNTAFTTGNAYAITGPNGSGKSTLLQVIAAAWPNVIRVAMPAQVWR